MTRHLRLPRTGRAGARPAARAALLMALVVAAAFSNSAMGLRR
jgi:hypothetical protein